ncbi:MAG: glycoside hydrolase family protein [Bacteroidota bacterium]
MKYIVFLSALILILISCNTKESTEEEGVTGDSTVVENYRIEFGKLSPKSVFRNDSLSIWGGSLVKGEDGLYHMYYSRWPKRLGWAWVTDSEIAHAVAESPFGPFKFKDVALGRTNKEAWDGWCTHNPTIHKFDGKYYLYYMGNTGDGKVVGEPGKEQLNWVHRNNQRIGVAVADNPNGPWKRLDKPVIDITHEDSLTHDALMTSNPSVCQRPDGGYLMVYKAVAKKLPAPNGGPVVHMVAISDSPVGPFKKYDQPIFTFEGEQFPAEDPYIWHQDGKYRAIVKRMIWEKKIYSLVHYDSEDGIHWNQGKYFDITDRTITWADGKKQRFAHLERPQVFIENGQPVALLCAADTLDENNVRHSFNVQIPLKITKGGRSD